MRRFLKYSSLLCIGIALSACEEKSSPDSEFPRDPQMARIQILNAFSATDAAIKSVAYKNPLIESVNADYGSSASGVTLQEMRGWNVQFVPEISKEDRIELLSFFKSLGDSYRELGGMRYPDYPDFEFSFTVNDQKTEIKIVAEGSYGKQ